MATEIAAEWCAWKVRGEVRARGAVHGGVVRGGETGLCVERAQGAVDALAEGAGGLGGGEDDRAAAPLRVGVVVVGGLGDPTDAGVPVEGAVGRGAPRLRGGDAERYVGEVLRGVTHREPA